MKKYSLKEEPHTSPPNANCLLERRKKTKITFLHVRGIDKHFENRIDYSNIALTPSVQVV